METCESYEGTHAGNPFGIMVMLEAWNQPFCFPSPIHKKEHYDCIKLCCFSDSAKREHEKHTVWKKTFKNKLSPFSTKSRAVSEEQSLGLDFAAGEYAPLAPHITTSELPLSINSLSAL